MAVEIQKPVEKCGIYAVVGQHTLQTTKNGLEAVQLRGQEHAKIVAIYPQGYASQGGPGLVRDVFNEIKLQNQDLIASVGHVRYSTSGSKDENAHGQPIIDSNLILAHNGNIHHYERILQKLDDLRQPVNGLNDSEAVHRLISYHCRRGAKLMDAVYDSYSDWADGAGTIVVMTTDGREAGMVKDKRGIRPGAIGELSNGSKVLASETHALNETGAKLKQELRGGEYYDVMADQVVAFDNPLEMPCGMEFAYFSDPRSMFYGRSIAQSRRNMGIFSAMENPIEGDLVIPVPHSGVIGGISYAEELGIPYFVPDAPRFRTFLGRDPKERKSNALRKFDIPENIISGKRVIFYDDTLVRGNNGSVFSAMAMEKGATDVSLVLGAPAYISPDVNGIDTPDIAQLMAANMSIEEMEKRLGLSKLAYLSIDRFVEACGFTESQMTIPYFNKVYQPQLGLILSR